MAQVRALATLVALIVLVVDHAAASFFAGTFKRANSATCAAPYTQLD